ncbi:MULTISPECIES: excinuclease ABC subunit UvrB [unclassified Breznakia]|uniref:excinuclease ABC subunit UvrB n=1 Tax=unclassified Breznakia TaxID=2623764 RepID=UPI0024736B6E|nr:MULTISPECIES: excinuclease ABC subunit UvrB [unclassified Breznakia]MDH6367257.1 excinuclease ABC subunit B [Breznakia sp. PH1-1]MDH6404436.1 excinuclease ABC subunit B [Breznakia sp. PF1-11]MDH6412173.1 excinuclease ABC subunit B [Breznakia sp. PFB1-11]MDH6414424.1 excinuclease ABC subunit B [Breznakia sp. PFB1-14]MDH6416809.1 excinuclease ABC subunit B [Breznakia sp. PFB1-4]
MEEQLFQLVSEFQPQGDQIHAIEELTQGILDNKKEQVLLGATGTGKTFTVSNVIAKVNKPTLVFVHNKTLAGQLYTEFKEFFPHNRVEYFVSNFDYYQPEAYIPTSDTYIDKTTKQNEELEMLRMSAVNSVLERRDTIIVASVACIYGSSDPSIYRGMFMNIRVNEQIDRKELIGNLVARQYVRNDMDLKKGTFRVRGDSIEIGLGYTDDYILRIELFDDIVERIVEVDPLTGKVHQGYQLYNIYPASGYATPKEQIERACVGIEKELEDRLEFFRADDKLLEAQRLEQRCSYDVEALREFGVCPGIENYSRHIDGRAPGQMPYTLFDYFPDDFLIVVDESHVSLPQIRGMFNGDRARKTTLVDYGFRLPSALDNRPLRFEEFEGKVNQAIYVSATPGDYELEKTDGEIVEQIIRPTGLLDPNVEIRKTMGQIDDIVDEINSQIERGERTLITTLTVRMAEELTAHLKQLDFKVAWLHHEVTTIERTEIIRELRQGKYDVLVGINLLREGLDIPEVSLICILDADKEGFLRSKRSLVQIIGRAARNEHGRVIMYADKMTDSMQYAIDETSRRRAIQEAYNKEHGITPKTIIKPIHEALHSVETKEMAKKYMNKDKKLSKKDKDKMIKNIEKEMKDAAKVLDFERAAELRDILLELRNE